MSMYRQGDILLVRVDETPAGNPVTRDGRGRIVLAEGEATGHAHAVLDPEAVLIETAEERFLRVLAEGGVDLTHEEHAAIRLPQGDYRVVRQREYVYPETGRRVTRSWSWVAD